MLVLAAHHQAPPQVVALRTAGLRSEQAARWVALLAGVVPWQKLAQGLSA